MFFSKKRYAPLETLYSQVHERKDFVRQAWKDSKVEIQSHKKKKIENDILKIDLLICLLSSLFVPAILYEVLVNEIIKIHVDIFFWK